MISAFTTYPDSSKINDFKARGDTFVFNLDKFATDWSDMAGRSPQGGMIAIGSTTSLTISVAQQTLVLNADKPFLPGMYVMIANTSSPLNYMYGIVNSYTPGTLTLVVDVLTTGGSGTLSAWMVSASARTGVIGGNASRVKTTGFPFATGSTNTRISQYENLLESVGADITANSDAVNGASFVINRPGFYYVSMVFRGPADIAYGISRNSTQLTTDIGSINASARLIYAKTGPSGAIPEQISTVAILSQGDILRPHVQGTVGGGNSPSTESITIMSLGF